VGSAPAARWGDGTMSPNAAALTSLLLALPMGLLLPAVVFDIEGLITSVLTDDGAQANPLGLGVMLGALVALPVALAVSLTALLRRGADGRRRLSVVNLLLAAAVVTLMVPRWGGVAQELYRCEVLGIPNCD
jgi:hypothetical protein